MNDDAHARASGTHHHPRARAGEEGARRATRRDFLGFLGGVGGALLLPDWGQRVFPMYPRTHTITLDDEMFFGHRLELRLPWEQMQAYIRKLHADAARMPIVRHALPDGRVETHRTPNPHVAKTYDDLIREGWKIYAQELPVDPVEKEIGRAAMCKRRVSVPGEDRAYVIHVRERHLVVPIRAFDTSDGGHADWVLKQHLMAGGMFSGIWRNQAKEEES